MSPIDGSHLVAKALKVEGVKYIFSLCGGSIIPIYEGCKDEGIEVIDSFSIKRSELPEDNSKVVVLQAVT